MKTMDRLTVKNPYSKGYVLGRMCEFGHCGEVDGVDGCAYFCNRRSEEYQGKGDPCPDCEFQRAFNRLAAYENTKLTPAEIEQMKADNERLHELLE